MKIALRADNDRYVCAEEGGGSVVRANRDAIGSWETFEVVGTNTLEGAPSVALKTDGGFYLCAEAGGGGVLSANRLSIGPWETFTFSAGTFLANDEQHYICCEVGSPDPILNVTRTAAGPWETFEVVVVETDPLPPSDPTLLKGAFCIPAESGRVWWPAFLAVSADEQDRYIAETIARGYTFGQVLVSGWPYANDYPHIDPDVRVLAAGLAKIKAAGLNTVVAFDDQQGSDLSYLKQILVPNRPLIDWSMMIYEINGVLKNPDLVLSVAKQTRALLPDAILAVHFTPLDEGNQSYGLVDWQRAKDEANLQCLFFQTAGWEVGIEDAAARLQDFTRRLGGPQFHGYPTLELGVNVYECTTSLTYRGQMSESQGKAFTDALMNAPLEPDDGVHAVPPTGFGDGGTP
jgi:hypothetical protein